MGRSTQGSRRAVDKVKHYGSNVILTGFQLGFPECL